MNLKGITAGDAAKDIFTGIIIALVSIEEAEHILNVIETAGYVSVRDKLSDFLWMRYGEMV